MLKVAVSNDAIHIGRYFSVSFQRTLRIPDDGKLYPLPPGLARFPVCRVADYQNSVPSAWKEHGGVFIPMYQREALWLNFEGMDWHPCAVKIGVGKINAVSGKPWDQRLTSKRQDYIVCPEQPWLDGINAGNGYIRQFVAMPLGKGYTVEGQLTGKEEFGGIQIMVFNAKPGRFPDTPPRRSFDRFEAAMCCKVGGRDMVSEMGLAAGGKMKQKIYEDPYGASTWAKDTFGRVYIHIVNSEMYRQITGKEPPPTPISAKTYSMYGLPWFDLYDQEKSNVEASPELAGIKSIKKLDHQEGASTQEDDGSLENLLVKFLGKHEAPVSDGKW